MAVDYLKEVQNQNKRLTAKFMTLIENNDPIALDQLKRFYLDNNHNKHQIIGITGLPGAGKSSLINALIKYYRQKDKIIGIVAIDPTSPLTGGALLGDRLRMDEFALDKKVFIRSMASRGRLGGIAPATSAFIKVLEKYGCDIIIVETVGTGQSETDIIGMADSVVLVTIPGTGDQVQALKAGIFEIADIYAVNKSDLEAADKQILFIKQVLALEHRDAELDWNPPAIKTIAINPDLEKNGLPELVSEINNHWNYLLKSGKLEARRKNKIKTEILAILQYFVSQELLNLQDGQLIKEAIENISNNKLDPYSFIHSFISSYNYDDFKKENNL